MTSRIGTRVDRSRLTIRWINIGGIDWDVIRAMAVKYNLHALSIQDILREQAHNQSKTDYYHERLFIRVLCHILDPDEEGGQDTSTPEPPRRGGLIAGVRRPHQRKTQAYKNTRKNGSPTMPAI